MCVASTVYCLLNTLQDELNEDNKEINLKLQMIGKEVSFSLVICIMKLLFKCLAMWTEYVHK